MTDGMPPASRAGKVHRANEIIEAKRCQHLLHRREMLGT
jgi:hypothetical protein